MITRSNVCVTVTYDGDNIYADIRGDNIYADIREANFTMTPRETLVLINELMYAMQGCLNVGVERHEDQLAEVNGKVHSRRQSDNSPPDSYRCRHGMFRSGAGACPECGGGAE